MKRLGASLLCRSRYHLVLSRLTFSQCDVVHGLVSLTVGGLELCDDCCQLIRTRAVRRPNRKSGRAFKVHSGVAVGPLPHILPKVGKIVVVSKELCWQLGN
ncbi:hypothetical protein QBC45DRAFT_428249 [Copromyces sp. CBS 386.78]|nr:hypothetical protein QBC45DRAFT_428249 [Copromyces sp. CBS 386.78]